MTFYLISIFPEIFTNFISASLIGKAVQKGQIRFFLYNPRSVCKDRHQKVDDIIYGGGAGLLMKAEPLVLTVEKIIKKHRLSDKSFKIIFVNPSRKTFTQTVAKTLARKYQHIIFITARYEWIDFRASQYLSTKYPDNFETISIWKYITLGWEVPAMAMIESISRLLDWVIQKEDSRKYESYSPELGSSKIEYPQYTRPEEVFGLKVPEVLLSGHHQKIENRKKENVS